MRTIICKKCGAPIDAALGECPICGAVYYILPQDDEDATRVWDNTAAGIHSAIERENMKEENDGDDATKVLPAVAAMKKPEEKPAPAPVRKAAAPQSKKPNNRSWLYAGLAAAMLAVLTLVMCFMTGVFDFNKNTQTMPDLMGLTRDVAVNQLRAIGMSPNIIYEESEEPEGTVIDQKPKAEETITKRTGINLTISSGKSESPAPQPEFVEVPLITDMSFAEAEAVLRALGLYVQKTEQFSDDVELGEVIEQSPLKGAKLAPGETVFLSVSKGAEEKEFTLVLTAGKGGSIDPAGAVTVKEGKSFSFAVSPDDGYELKELRIDGESVGSPGQYTIEDVDADHSIYAVFAALAESPRPEETPDREEHTLPASPTNLR